MRDNPHRWENEPKHSTGWIPYTENDIEELRKLKERKVRKARNKRKQKNLARKYRFKK